MTTVFAWDCNVANPERCLIILCGTNCCLTKDFSTHMMNTNDYVYLLKLGIVSYSSAGASLQFEQNLKLFAMWLHASPPSFQ